MGHTSMVFFIFLLPTKSVVFSCNFCLGADWSGQGRTSAPFENRCLYLRGMNLLFH